MSYAVKEMYYTLQGEGGQTGRAAVFCRFAGCNLWTGRENDRNRADCQFCDTDFLGTDGPGGGQFSTADELADAIMRCWAAVPEAVARRFVVFTGGEPALQFDEPLASAVHARSFEIAIETNGTKELPAGIDWICVSPKSGTEVVVRSGQELKLVYPQPGLLPEVVQDWAFQHRFLQPMDGPNRESNTQAAISYCLAHPQWRLSLQTHKLIGIP